MKAIIELSRKGSIFGAVAQQVAGSRRGRTPEPMSEKLLILTAPSGKRATTSS